MIKSLKCKIIKINKNLLFLKNKKNKNYCSIKLQIKLLKLKKLKI